MVYIDMSGADKCAEIVRTKRGYRKCYRAVNLIFKNIYFSLVVN